MKNQWNVFGVDFGSYLCNDLELYPNLAPYSLIDSSLLL